MTEFDSQSRHVPAEISRRRRYVRRVLSAFAVGVVALFAATMSAMAMHSLLGDDVPAMLLGLVAGFAAVATAALLMPLVRRASGSTTESRLLRAASPTHPLLRKLMLDAPGTYAHSVMVANLAETAADAIGADALLARVGAYYHDVGKLSAPCFFFENLYAGQNPHDARTPTESVAIITAHVGDGLILAEEHNLPKPVRDIVRQHHGNSLVRYFYHKASVDDAGVFEADYRYRGDHPSSREAGLVMLADGCEAAVRALSDPDDDTIADVVSQVFSEKRADGQLDQSHLSEGEMEAVRAMYAAMLTSMRHARCEYPRMTQ